MHLITLQISDFSKNVTAESYLWQGRQSGLQVSIQHDKKGLHVANDWGQHDKMSSLSVKSCLIFQNHTEVCVLNSITYGMRRES